MRKKKEEKIKKARPEKGMTAVMDRSLHSPRIPGRIISRTKAATNGNVSEVERPIVPRVRTDWFSWWRDPGLGRCK